MQCIDCKYSESRLNVLGNDGKCYCTKHLIYVDFESTCPDYNDSDED